MTDNESIIRRVVREELGSALASDPPERRPLVTSALPTPRRGTRSAVGDEVLAQLARLRQTQSWLAAETGIPIATLSRRLRDSEEFRVGELRRVTDVLSVELGALFAL